MEENPEQKRKCRVIEKIGVVTLAESTFPQYKYTAYFPGPDGKRRRKFFNMLTHARLWAKKMAREAASLGDEFPPLDEDERSAIALWRTLVEEEAGTAPPFPPLRTVIEDFRQRREHTRSEEDSLTVEKSVEEFMEEQQAAGLSESHIQTLRVRTSRFATAFAKRPVASIRVEEISHWILGLKTVRGPTRKPLSLQTKKGFRLVLHSFFNFCRIRGWVDKNPVTEAAKPRPKRTPPEIMPPEAVAEFFDALATHSPQMVPFWAIKFYAGIRDAETVRLDWRAVDLRNGEINLVASVTKTGQPRTVKILPVLGAWLEPYAKPSGLIAPQSTMSRRWATTKALRTLSVPLEEGGRPRTFTLPHNAGRHCFATYHLLKFRNAGETAMQLGHNRSPELLHRHYKGLATEEEAAAFWSIRPTAHPPGNVLSIDADAGSSKGVTTNPKVASRGENAARHQTN